MELMTLEIERLEERIAPGLISVRTGDILSDNFHFFSHNETEKCCEQEKEKEKAY
jgi:hypothetical protein